MSPPLRFEVTNGVSLLILEVLRVSSCYAAAVEVSLMIFEVGPCRHRFATVVGVSLMTIKFKTLAAAARRLTLCGGKLRRLPLTDMRFELSHRNTWVSHRAGPGRLQTFDDIFVVTGPKSLI